jgi:hypothetical protein
MFCANHSGGASMGRMGVSPLYFLMTAFSDIGSEYFSKLYQVLGEKNLKISLTLGRKCPKTFSRFGRKILLKLSLILRENISQIFSSIGEKNFVDLSLFSKTVSDELSPILETVSDQFSSILKIVSGEFSSFFGGSFCNMSFPTFRKVSKSSNAFNQSHSDPIGQQLSRA